MSAAHVLLRAGAESLAVPVACVHEVDRMGALTAVPGAPAGVLGVRTVRGRVLPVLDLAGLLGIPGARPAQVVLAEHGDRRAGLAVDAIVDVVPMDPSPEAGAGPLVTGSALGEGRLVGVVDVGRLFDAIEAG